MPSNILPSPVLRYYLLPLTPLENPPFTPQVRSKVNPLPINRKPPNPRLHTRHNQGLRLSPQNRDQLPLGPRDLLPVGAEDLPGLAFSQAGLFEIGGFEFAVPRVDAHFSWWAGESGEGGELDWF